MAKSEFVVGFVKIQMDNSPWSIRYYADGRCCLFWADKEYATHETHIDLQEHINNLEMLENSRWARKIYTHSDQPVRTLGKFSNVT